MSILVTAASKHGATMEIAEAIAETLVRHGLDVEVRPAEEVYEVAGYDAVVVGSGIYAGHWLKPAKDLIATHEEVLRARPVWLFSSGPIGDPPLPADDPADVAELVGTCGAREHRLFAGRLERTRLGLGERAVVMALRAPDGDFRDWVAIEEWAATIADALS